MVTISDCQRCGEQFPSLDLCPNGLCVRCYDKSPDYWEGPRKGNVLLSDEEKKRRRKERKRIYQINNSTKIATYERERRARLQIKREE